MTGGFAPLTVIPVEALLQDEQVKLEVGLTAAAVRERLERFGLNEIAGQAVSPWRVLGRQFHSSFVWLLLAAGSLSWMLGEKIDGLTIYLFVLLNTAISFFQEYRSEQTVQLLKKYMEPTANVRRAGQVLTVNRKELVPGDIVILEAGDMIPADLRFLQVDNFAVDESVLTGESTTTFKSVEASKEEIHQAYRAGNIGFSGTTVVQGNALGLVFATGSKTFMGEVAHLVQGTKRESGFQEEMNHFSAFILKIILSTLAILFVVNYLTDGKTVSLAELFVFSIALAVSVVPEALPVVTTFSLSKGALRLAEKKVVVKRLAAIEDLGAIEVLCTDKTGTLTENHLTVKDVHGKDRQTILEIAAKASLRSAPQGGRAADAFDQALFEVLGKAEQRALGKIVVRQEIPFDPTRRRNSVLVDGELIVRGAPENILAACQMKAEERVAFVAWLKEQGREGARTLAVATKPWSGSSYQSEDEEQDLHCVGLIAFVDPVKPSTKAAVSKAEKLGVDVKILTGDSPEVAGAVAHHVGLIDHPTQVLTGAAFEQLPEGRRHQAVEDYQVFARVSPQQKHAIIKLLEEKHRVGFLGEGINDAPALKAANVAIVVESASDIAREASDIVLLQQSLQVVVDGIVEGRVVFANTLKYIKATLASNFGNFYAIALASLFINYLPLLPLQILLVNLLTDFPMISSATDSTDADQLLRPEKYHLKDLALFTTIIGLVSTVFDLIFFAVFRPMGPGILQTSWFIGSVLSELVFLFSVRTRLPFFRARRPGLPMVILSLLAGTAALLLPFTLFGADLFHFVMPTVMTMTISLIIVMGDFIACESAKLAYYRFFGKTQ